MLEKNTLIDKIEVLQNGAIQVRSAIQIMENGVVISSNFHRHAVMPGDDYSLEDPRVSAICSVTHTPEIVQEYLNKINGK
jgi:archaellum component FlaF (FlaF/FlaG flagellin family)